MEIRAVQPEEINTIVDMWVDFVDDQYQYDDFFIRNPEGKINLKNKLHHYVKDDDYLLIGAIKDNKIAGYVLAQVSEHPPFFETSKFCNIRHVFLKPEYRNKKYGTKLMQYTIEWAKEKGVERAELLVAAKNEDAIRFYRNLGFNDFCLVMTKNLEGNSSIR